MDHPNQLVFGDESGRNDKTVNRRLGRSRRFVIRCVYNLYMYNELVGW